MLAAACLLLAHSAPQAARPAPDKLLQRAAAVAELATLAQAGKLVEYGRATAALQACADALAKPDIDRRQALCQAADRQVQACTARQLAVIGLQDSLAADALAAGRIQQVAAAIGAPVPACPAQVPGFAVGPGEAPAEQARRDRRSTPGHLLCDSLLRALLDAAEKNSIETGRRLATEMIYECDARHPEYRLQAVAALTRLGLDAEAVLGRIRSAPAAAGPAASARPAPAAPAPVRAPAPASSPTP